MLGFVVVCFCFFFIFVVVKYLLTLLAVRWVCKI